MSQAIFWILAAVAVVVIVALYLMSQKKKGKKLLGGSAPTVPMSEEGQGPSSPTGQASKSEPDQS